MTQENELCRKHAGFKGKIGIARDDITPPVGIYSRNWGAALHDTADSIHRSLTVTALSISQASESEPLILVDADLGWWRPQDCFTQFQKRLLSELGVDSSRLLFALTHTHAAAPLMEADSSLAGSELLQTWMEEVYQTTLSVIRQAMENRHDAVLDWHQGRCSLATNRDLPDPADDSNRFVCGYNPSGQADDTLSLGRITDATGELLATIVNYACHPTTLAWENTSISPDYIGAMRETMEKETGAKALFLQGMSGDLSPRHQYVGDVDVADRHGRQLGFAALAVLNDMEPAGNEFVFEEVVESGAPLAVWRHQQHELSTDLQALQFATELKLKDWPSAAELEEQRKNCKDRALEERLRRQRDIRKSMGDGSTWTLPVYAWKLGDAVLVGCAGEAYSKLQMDLRNRFPDLTLVCMNLVNGSVGYLPPDGSYDHDIYPVWQTPFDRGCLERTAESMAEAITELQRKTQAN